MARQDYSYEEMQYKMLIQDLHSTYRVLLCAISYTLTVIASLFSDYIRQYHMTFIHLSSLKFLYIWVN